MKKIFFILIFLKVLIHSDLSFSNDLKFQNEPYYVVSLFYNTKNKAEKLHSFYLDERFGVKAQKKQSKKILNYERVTHPDSLNLHIKKLIISSQWIDSFTVIAKNFPNVEEIKCSGVFINFPQEILKFKKLKVLSFSSSIQNFETNSFILFQISKIKTLRFLNLEGLPYLYLPERISNLDNLIQIHTIVNSNLLQLPICFRFLTKLKIRYLSFDVDKDGIDLNNFEKINSNVMFFPYYINEKSSFENLNIYPQFCEYCDIRFGKSNTNYFTPFINFSSHLIKKLKNPVEGYYENQNINYVGNLDNNNPDGVWKFYYKNGRVKEERNFKNGIEIGDWKTYDSTGNIIARYLFNQDSSYFNYYYSNGIKKSEFILVNQLPADRWRKFNQLGELNFEYFFKDNKLEKVINYIGITKAEDVGYKEYNKIITIFDYKNNIIRNQYFFDTIFLEEKVFNGQNFDHG